jgi:hypothetical protein
MKVEAKAPQTNKTNKGGYQGQRRTPVTNQREKKEFKPKQKIEQTKYIKTFQNFEDGIKEMINFSGDIDDLLRDSAYEIYNPDGAMAAVLEVFTSHMPSSITRENLHYDINLSANRCSLKTDRFLSFGWFIKSTRQQDNTYKVEYIFQIITFGERQDALAESLLNAGWVKDTYNK